MAVCSGELRAIGLGATSGAGPQRGRAAGARSPLWRADGFVGGDSEAPGETQVAGSTEPCGVARTAFGREAKPPDPPNGAVVKARPTPVSPPAFSDVLNNGVEASGKTDEFQWVYAVKSPWYQTSDGCFEFDAAARRHMNLFAMEGRELRASDRQHRMHHSLYHSLYHSLRHVAGCDDITKKHPVHSGVSER